MESITRSMTLDRISSDLSPDYDMRARGSRHLPVHLGCPTRFSATASIMINSSEIGGAGVFAEV